VSSLRFLANLFGNVPWARDSGHPGMTSHIGRVRCCLPLLQRRRRGDREYFGADSSRLASSLSTLRHPPVTRWMARLATDLSARLWSGGIFTR